MKVKNLPRITVVCLLTLAATLNARAWDGTGHMLVSQIAYDRLTDKARARVDELASKIQKNGVPYNGVNIACWADDIKGRDSDSPFRGEFRPWHYIDIGCSPADPDELSNPPTLSTTNGNILVALTHCVDLIKNKQTDALIPNESVAMALVIHFVGDIHQPLHTTGRYDPETHKQNDAGGNGVPVANFAQSQWPPNLHTFWDEAYRRYYENGDVKALPPITESDPPGSPARKEWLKTLEPYAPKDPNLKYDVKVWAMESHEIACKQVYGTLGSPYGAKDVKLTEEYVKAGTDTARRQIVLAGYRLAALLNDLYGK